MPKSVLAALPASLLAAAGTLGHDPRKIARRAGLEPEALGDPDARIPVELHARLWESLAELGDDIGLSLGEALGGSALGVVGHAMRHATTVGDALSCLSRYRRVVLDDAVPVLETGTRAGARCAFFTHALPPRFARLRHPAECQVMATLTWLRRTAAEHVVPLEVAFPHPRPRGTTRHRAALGQALRWSASDAVLTVSADVLARPIPHADADVHGYLDARARALLEGLGDDSFADAVGAIIAHSLALGTPTRAPVARRLGTSPRTLHRRLEAEGTSFAAIVDSVRATRARARLLEPGASIGAIAYELGFSEPAAFTRAFRRWTGATPDDYRRARASHEPSTPRAARS
jgi:AraC-like DNA-binding protein